MLTLGIDTSCDDTSLALLDGETVLSNLSTGQDEFHARFGGVVPEISSRKHLETILPLFVQLLEQNRIHPGQIELIAATRGPGLIGALLVGATFANCLAATLSIPVIGIHHLEGHLFSPAIDSEPLPLKHIALIISGGHTRLITIEGPFNYREIGSTRDDAAGELIDKTGRLLGFPYPGGKMLDDAAMSYDSRGEKFPKPMKNSPDFDFSFSGLKTAVLYYLRDLGDEEPDCGKIAKGIMTSLADVLSSKALRACEELGIETLAISGGVSASRFLRKKIGADADAAGIDLRFPKMEYTIDNAAMIAAAGYARFKAGYISESGVKCAATLPLK